MDGTAYHVVVLQPSVHIHPSKTIIDIEHAYPEPCMCLDGFHTDMDTGTYQPFMH